MANKQNLLRGNPPTQFRSGRQAVEDGRKGGIASGKSRRVKRLMRDDLDELLESEDMRLKLARALIDEALGGNVRAYEVIRDTMGENPKDAFNKEKEKMSFTFHFIEDEEDEDEGIYIEDESSCSRATRYIADDGTPTIRIRSTVK